MKTALSLFAALLFAGCGGASHVRLSSEPSAQLPSNYVDARPKESRYTQESGNSSYYGDDHLTPPLSSLFLMRLSQALGHEIGETRVVLKRADVVVTLPNFTYPLQGGPLMLLTEPKYVRVDLSGQIGDTPFIHGVTRKVYAGPTDSDIRGTVDQAIDETIAWIRRKY